MTKTSITSRILACYTKGQEAALYNINEIAHRTGAAYPHTYNAVNELLSTRILNEHDIGRGRYCTPNLANPETRTLLSQALYEEQRREKTPNKENLRRELERLALQEPRLLTAILTKQKTHLLITDHGAEQPLLQATNIVNLAFHTPKEFSQLLLKEPELLTESEALFSYERFLLQLSSIHAELRQRLARPYQPTVQHERKKQRVQKKQRHHIRSGAKGVKR